jgi:hypothetical protein
MDRLERIEAEDKEEAARAPDRFDVPSDILEVPTFLRRR